MLNTKLILGGVGPQFSKFVAEPYNNAKAGLNANQVVSTKAAYFFVYDWLRGQKKGLFRLFS